MESNQSKVFFSPGGAGRAFSCSKGRGSGRAGSYSCGSQSTTSDGLFTPTLAKDLRKSHRRRRFAGDGAQAEGFTAGT